MPSQSSIYVHREWKHPSGYRGPHIYIQKSEIATASCTAAGGKRSYRRGRDVAGARVITFSFSSRVARYVTMSAVRIDAGASASVGRGEGGKMQATARADGRVVVALNQDLERSLRLLGQWRASSGLGGRNGAALLHASAGGGSGPVGGLSGVWEAGDGRERKLEQ